MTRRSTQLRLRIVAMAIILSLSSLVHAQLIKAKPVNATQPAAAPTQAEPGSGFRVAGALTGVLALIFVLKWGARFFVSTNSSRNAGAIAVLSRHAIGPRQQLLLIQLGKRVLLVANGGAQMNTLCEINNEEEVSDLLRKAGVAPAVSATFGSIFKKEVKKFESEEPEPRLGSSDDPDLGLARAELQELLGKVKGLSKSFQSAGSA